ncbi:MAG: type II toxin-antitoxin system RelE/ParE family toxin [Betaproteobacteria bacterium]|nr:type II toxin-antitoxin system RelE/ParE family toxin [Betaproteobacteria bacterium]
MIFDAIRSRHPAAEKEWARLDNSVKARFKTRLAERLENPPVANAALSGARDLYRIKITSPQFRLAYHIDDASRRLTILAVTSRDDVYDALASRLKK